MPSWFRSLTTATVSTVSTPLPATGAPTSQVSHSSVSSGVRLVTPVRLNRPARLVPGPEKPGRVAEVVLVRTTRPGILSSCPVPNRPGAGAMLLWPAGPVSCSPLKPVLARLVLLKSTSMSTNQPVPAMPALAPCSGAKTSMLTGLACWLALPCLGAGRWRNSPLPRAAGAATTAAVVRTVLVMASSRWGWVVGREHAGPARRGSTRVGWKRADCAGDWCQPVNRDPLSRVTIVAMTRSDRDEQLLRALHDQYAAVAVVVRRSPDRRRSVALAGRRAGDDAACVAQPVGARRGARFRTCVVVHGGPPDRGGRVAQRPVPARGDRGGTSRSWWRPIRWTRCWMSGSLPRLSTG